MSQEITTADHKYMTLVANYGEKSTEELLKAIDDFNTITAEALMNIAAIAHVLEERGEKLTFKRSGVGAYLPAIHARRVLPEAVLLLIDYQTALKAVAQLPLNTQRDIIKRGSIPVLREDGVKDVELLDLTKGDIARAFDPINGTLLTPDEQRAPVKRGATNLPREYKIIIKLNETEHAAIQKHAKRRSRSAASLFLESARDDGLLTERGI